MYFQPYGDDQQLNLNWIINEIINLHKQLDPDYETPSFTQVYPYSNLNRLNLDWVLSELKALKELAPEPTPEVDIQTVAEALVALPFDSNTSYQIYDFISKDGEIWRATEAIAAGGEWDETKWFKTKIGTDLAVLERWINTINNSLTSEIQARQDADTTLQTNIDNEALARQQADTALQNTINELTSANISDDSDAGGANVKASLNALKGSLTSEQTVRQNADTALQNNITNLLSAIAVNETTTGFLSGSLVNLTGSIGQNVGGHIIGNVMLITGRVRIAVSTRTGSNGGVRYTLPNNKVIDGTVNSIYAGMTSYTDATRNGESTIIVAANGSNYIDIFASESFANITAGKTLLLYVPPTIVKLKDA